jgi:alginate O-acetyltransferase complex protein AlgJ
LNQVVQKVKAYHDVFKSRGIRFIFLPIPDKETIFYKLLGTPRPVFLRQLVDRLKQLGVETVDTQPAFEKAFEEGVLPYQNNDTHWNAEGVKIAADLLIKVIKEKDSILPHS